MKHTSCFSQHGIFVIWLPFKVVVLVAGMGAYLVTQWLRAWKLIVSSLLTCGTLFAHGRLVVMASSDLLPETTKPIWAYISVKPPSPLYHPYNAIHNTFLLWYEGKIILSWKPINYSSVPKGFLVKKMELFTKSCNPSNHTQNIAINDVFKPLGITNDCSVLPPG